MKLNGMFGVDAGNISVLDSAFVKENGGTDVVADDEREGMRRTIQVKPGKYRVSIHIRDTWRDSEEDGGFHIEEEIEVKGTSLIVGDACYSWSSGVVEHDVWSAFLDKTDFLKDMQDRGVCADTGGDGEFDLEVTVTEVP